MKKRVEKDSLGEVLVDGHHQWGAQTQRSLNNFKIGSETMPMEIIRAIVAIKKCAATANKRAQRLSAPQEEAIAQSCTAILDHQWDEEFPLSVWQTGSGTQSNMNVNEVIAKLGGQGIHPNDHVNLSQSSNDVFPSAMHIAVRELMHCKLMPALDRIIVTFNQLELKFSGILKIGRTHLQDATPLLFSQQLSGYRAQCEAGRRDLLYADTLLAQLAIGATAVGTGINSPQGFDDAVCTLISEHYGRQYCSADNKFRALSSKDSLVVTHSMIKTLATNLIKITNDLRWMASGPRAGLNEINLPANEPGSSIMPGKVNPTQIEALNMVCLQIMGNDVSISMANSQGHFELNTTMPLIAYNMIQSLHLLSDAMQSFNDLCLKGIEVNAKRNQDNLSRSLMVATALTPLIGYDQAAKVVQKAYAENRSIKEVVMAMDLLSEHDYDQAIDLMAMSAPDSH